MVDTRRIVTLQISALVHGEKAVLIDCDGRQLGANAIPLRRLQPAGSRGVARILWTDTAASLSQQANAKASHAHKRTAWDRKINNLAGSYRLRSRDISLPRGRRRSQEYPTTDWPGAVDRMVEQAHNCYRYNSRSGWVRWSYTVTKNENRRACARYAKDRNHQVA